MFESFTGGKQSSTPESIQLIERLGIVYSIATLYGFLLIYIPFVAHGCNWIYSSICLIGALYSLSLCVLISLGQPFWADNAISRNAPFIAINLIFYFLG
jgi:hypothetical protein